MQDQPLHFRFWFIVPEYQAELLNSKELLRILEAKGVTVYPSPAKEFNGYIILSMRLRPPSVKEWKDEYGLDVFGITAGLDDLPPYQDLLAAVENRREDERRKMFRASGVTQGEAIALCRERELWGYRLCLAEFKTREGQYKLFWTIWFEDRALQGVIVRDNPRLKPRIKWLGDEGVWPFKGIQFVQVASPGIQIDKEIRP